MHTDHTLLSESITTVDAYDRRLDTYFVREGIKRKNKKVDLEKITREGYTLHLFMHVRNVLICCADVR